jgi:uncharacterized short protein YbdD (DUF466 family)
MVITPMDTWTVIKESTKKVCGLHDESFVLEERKVGPDDSPRTEYVTHRKLYHPGREPFTASGNYFTTLKAAEKNYRDRCKDEGVKP